MCVFTRWCLEMYKRHYSGSFNQDPSKLYTRQEMLGIFKVSEMNIDGLSTRRELPGNFEVKGNLPDAQIIIIDGKC